MDALPRLSPEQVAQFKERMHRQVEEFAEQMLENVENARVGYLIVDSDERAREAVHRFGEVALEAAVQLKIDAAEASFPPSRGSGDRSGDGTAQTPPLRE